MLATLTDQLPTEGKWIYEPKLDGVRALIYVTGGTVRIYSRNQKLLNDAYPELVEALSGAVRGEAVLDGEIVAFDPERGITSFASASSACERISRRARSAESSLAERPDHFNFPHPRPSLQPVELPHRLMYQRFSGSPTTVPPGIGSAYSLLCPGP